MTSYPIGAQMYSLRDRMTDEAGIRQVLKDVKKLGYNTCQMSGFSRAVAPEAIRDALCEAGIECGATHFGFPDYENNLDEIVRIHKLWSCRYPGVGSMPDMYRASREGFVEFAKKASAIAEKLADQGLHFIYHNHAFELQKFDGLTGLEILMENSSPALQFELDLFWLQAGGASPEDWIEKVAGRMDVVHFKEMVGGNTLPMMAPIGDGNMNWPRLMEKCDQIGVKYAFIEQDNAVDTDSLHCMERSIRYLSSIGGRF